jgi:hypothetical protein
MTIPTHPSEEILRTNLPKRKDIVEGLEKLTEVDPHNIRTAIASARERWEELGVTLEQEKELEERFEHMIVTLQQKSESELQSAKQNEIDSLGLIKELEQFGKDNPITPERLQDIDKAWTNLHIEEGTEIAKRFRKAEEKASARLKGEETQKKIKEFEELVEELQALKGNAELKLSERQNTLRHVRDRVKSLELHSGQQVSKLRERFNNLNQELSQELGWERWSSSKRKEDLVQKSAAIFDGTQACENLREALLAMQAEWKEIGFTSREDDALWEKFKVNCDGIYNKIKDAFGENEKKRDEILARLEQIKESTDWKKTADEMQELQNRWKELSDVSRKAARKQGDAYRIACDHFFNRRREHLKETRDSHKSNLKEKQDLIARVKRLQNESDWRKTLPEVREIQEKWKAVGVIPRKQSESIWKEFQEACNIIYEKRRTEDDVRDAEFEGNYTKKQEILAEMTTLLEGTDLSAIRTQFQSLDKNWNEAGRVPRNKQRDVETQYRDLLKKLEDREQVSLKERQTQLEQLSEEKAGICANLEALLFADSWDGSSEEVQILRDRWETLGNCAQEKELKKRSRQALQWLDKEPSDALRGQIRSEAQKSSKKLESLVLKLEQLAGINSSGASAAAMRQMMIAELQAKMGRNNNFVNKKEEAIGLVKEIRTIGPIAPDILVAYKARIEASMNKLWLDPIK